MKNSAERIQYITEYLISYKQKIEKLNKNGLFDTATLYELFALETCNLWFGKQFSNLNSDTANFPYVDLISEDGQFYVQVSTAQDIPAKIKKTLEKIKNSKSNKVSGVNKLFFFVLGNESMSKIPDYSGPNKIGNINFIASDHVITIDHIIEKSKNDLNFQISLYNILVNESKSYHYNAEKLNEMSDLSKALILKNIDNLINNEYEINRDDIVTTIKNDNHQFISIQGNAGTGKSALCKKLMSDEEIVLYARAEKITEVINLKDIWDIDINKTLKFLNGKKIVFFIDALEFIADGKKTKMDLLHQLYELVSHYNHAHIITSCRTCDKTSFIKLESNYNIYVYPIPELTDEEIILIGNKYPLIQKICNFNSYMQLIRIPFYLNLIISKIKSIDNIKDVNELRSYIWQNIICLKNKQIQSDISTLDIRDTINDIVFTRAKEFLTGISNEKIDSKILNLLISEGVITQSENKIRLKYDIFEDICFENYFDEKFDNSKGNFTAFFSEIENLGRCVYRRYQIWIENKLFAKNNREKFLYSLIASNIIPETWKQQTIIGIVKSTFCTDFFIEYGNLISENNLKEFLKTINMFSFEAKIMVLKYGNSYASLNPVGYGRSSLIKLLKTTNKFKDIDFKEDAITICTDYSKQNNIELETASIACEILEYFVEDIMINLDKEKIYSVHKIINEYLAPIYLMGKYSKTWIKKFWEDIVIKYKQPDNYLSKEIIKYVLKNTTVALAKELPLELCNLAEVYWIYFPKKNDKTLYLPYNESSRSKNKDYRLNDNAENYSHDFRSVDNNIFFWTLTKYNFITALDWAIKMTNHIVDAYKEKNPQNVLDIDILIDKAGNIKKYIGNTDFWLTGTEETSVHELIGDIIYILKQETLRLFKSTFLKEETKKSLGTYLKNHIYEKSNNIIMLTVIQDIGYQCSQLFPGYAIELGSSIEIIMWDIQKVVSLHPDSNTLLLKDHIYKTIGIPFIKERYAIKKEFVYPIQKYMLDMQVCGDLSIKSKVENILDYLYSQIPNDPTSAKLHLQIQKMDLRNAKIYKIDKDTLAVTPQISGEAEKIVNEAQNSNFNLEQKAIYDLLDDCTKKIKNKIFSTDECITTIDKLYNIISLSDIPYMIEKDLILFISHALTKEDLDKNKRSELCRIWINGINKIFENKCFIYEYSLSYILFKQIEEDIENSVLENLKKLMLKCLIYKDHQDGILMITTSLQKYLLTNEKIAKSLFNTVVVLSENKMNRYIFNVNYIIKKYPQEKYTYVPNRQKPIYSVGETEENIFKNKEDEIISKYLLNNKMLDLTYFDINNYDIGLLCYVSNCGLNLNDSNFYKVMKEIINDIIDIFYYCDYSYDFLNEFTVINFFKKRFVDSNDINLELDLLFSDIDYSKFTRKTYEFYEDTMSLILPVFFDSYNSSTMRSLCINNIKNIEKSLLSIANKKVKTKLSKIMFLTLGKCHLNNWNELQTNFSYLDKHFLNTLWSKYGKDHLTGMFNVIYQLHIKELLPEVLISVNNCFNEIKKKDDSFKQDISEVEYIINMLITKAFLDFNDEIKQDEELTESFENILETLVMINFKAAAVILDEFRIH